MKRVALPTCPDAGEGVHRWIFICCLRLHERGIPVDQWDQYIAPKASRELQPGEIANAAKTVTKQGYVPGPKWSNVLETVRDSILAGPGTLASLAADSPFPIMEGGPSYTTSYMATLFPGDPLINAGPSKFTFTTRTLTEWGEDLARMQFVVPSPMQARHGHTVSGKRSAHCLDATGPRIYLVVEFDKGTLDDHSKLLRFLSIYAPLAMVVHSGNKSLHGWFMVADETEDTIQRFFDRTVMMGADVATWTRSQFVRMPDGLRTGGIRQRVIYFDPTKTWRP